MTALEIAAANRDAAQQRQLDARDALRNVKTVDEAIAARAELAAASTAFNAAWLAHMSAAEAVYGR